MKASEIKTLEQLVWFIVENSNWESYIHDIIRRNGWQDITDLVGNMKHRGEEGVCMDAQGYHAVCLKDKRPYINNNPRDWAIWQDD